MRIRTAAFFAVQISIFFISLLWVFQERIEIGPLGTYWLQVFSGNWSPDFMSKPEYKDHHFQYLLGSGMAVILNLVTIGALLTTAIKLIFIRGREMQFRTLLETKDDIVLRRVLDLFPEAQRSTLMPRVEGAIRDANTEWREELVSELVPERSLDDFERTLNKNFDPR